MKSDLRIALQEEHEALTDIPSSPLARHKFSGGDTASRPTAVAAIRRIYLNSQKNQIEIENFGQALPAASPKFGGYASPIFPTGGTVKMVFYMASPPTGWTAVAENDKALRVVSSGGTGGTSGGTTAFSSAWAAGVTGSEASHTHSVPSAIMSESNTQTGTTSSVGTAPDISDKFLTGIGGADVGTFNYRVVNASYAGDTTGAGASHSHITPAYAPQYIDVIVASFD